MSHTKVAPFLSDSTWNHHFELHGISTIKLTLVPCVSAEGMAKQRAPVSVMLLGGEHTPSWRT